MFTAQKNTIRLVCLAVISATAVLNPKLLSAVNSPNVEKNTQGEIVIHTSEQIGTINADIYGVFMELALHHFNQGMWAEMLKSRKFAEHDGEDESYGVVKNWYSIGKNNNTYFMHDNTVCYTGTQSQKIISEDAANKRTGIGQGNLYFDKQKSYLVRVNLRQEKLSGPVIIALEADDKVYDAKELNLKGQDWQRFEFTLKPGQTEKNGKFTITYAGAGTLWIGSASLMPDDNISGYRKDVIELLQALHIPNIRWPGGNAVSRYHWLDGIGDRDKRPARRNKAWLKDKQWETNDVGVHEFIQLCQLLGAKPYMALNSGDGTATEAANLVQYCNGSTNTKYGKLRAQNGHSEPFNIKLWGIGNEMFGNWQIGHVDEETYARRHLEIANAILSVDKDIKIVAVGGRYWKYPRWNQALFNIAEGKFDYLSLHSYAKKYRRTLKKEELKDPKLAEETYYYAASSPYGIEEQIIETDKEIRKALPNREDIKIAFDEWNMFLYKHPKIQPDFALRDGIYTAGVFHAFRRQHKAVTLANFALAVNMLGLIIVNQETYFVNPAYLIFKMYADHSGPILLKSDVKCDSFSAPEYEKGRPQAKAQIPFLDVSATASRDGKKLYVAIINLHADKTVETKISFDKWGFASDVKFTELYDDDYMTENTFENPNRLTIKEDVLKNVSNNFSYNFKPHSVTVMEFQR